MKFKSLIEMVELQENPIQVLFQLRDVAHAKHLNTTSYAEHEALNGFYTEILELADSFLETYQGVHGRINDTFTIDVNPSVVLV
jgi:hypothetical protein